MQIEKVSGYKVDDKTFETKAEAVEYMINAEVWSLFSNCSKGTPEELRMFIDKSIGVIKKYKSKKKGGSDD